MLLRTVTAAAVGAVMILSACASAPSTAEVDGEARRAPDASLQTFYNQSLAWTDCGDGNECSTLLVPVDYDDPAAGTLELAVLRRPATGSDPLGDLVVNPGGPGASGVEFAAAADTVLTPRLRAVYSLVGFDPRGVGDSAPVECLSDAQLDAWLAVDASPDSAAETAEIEAQAEQFADACAAADQELLARMDTGSVVRDLDVLRAALDQPTLDYLGFSYGTLIGALYADEFGDRVGRFVLDGAVDPTLTNSELSRQQAIGFERALERYIDYCIAAGDCPLGETRAQAVGALSELLEDIDAQPLPTSDPERPLTQSLALTGVLYPLYQPRYGWPLLTGSLRQAVLGDGSGLLRTVDIFTSRSEAGFPDNRVDALTAVNCIDRPDRPDPGQTAQLAEQWTVEAPFFGSFLAYGNLPCYFWPVPAIGQAGAVAAVDAPAILVVGTEFDPATPYQWSQALSDQLTNGVLLTWAGGDGHTAYRSGSVCIDSTIDAFLISGELPENGAVCD